MDGREFLEHVLKSVIEQEAMRGRHSKYQYMRVLKELRNDTSGIDTLRKAQGLKYVGARTFGVIQDKATRLSGKLAAGLREGFFGMEDGGGSAKWNSSNESSGEKESECPAGLPPAIPEYNSLLLNTDESAPKNGSGDSSLVI